MLPSETLCNSLLTSDSNNSESIRASNSNEKIFSLVSWYVIEHLPSVLQVAENCFKKVSKLSSIGLVTSASIADIVGNSDELCGVLARARFLD